MKSIIKGVYKPLFFLLLAVAVTGSLLAIVNPKVEKKKVLERTVKLTSSQKVEIENSFGNVTVTNRPGNEMHIKVTAIANANTDQKAQEILDRISMEFSEGNTIRYETDIKGSGNSKGKTHMEINVELSLPEGNSLEIENSFGATSIPNRNGLTELEQKFGDLSTGSLSRVKEISVEFGSLKAQTLTGGNMSFKYSDIQIAELNGSINSTYEFCKSSKLSFGNDLSKINIKNAYSDLSIDVPSNFSGDFRIRTSFGELINKSGISIKATEEDNDFGPKFDKDYEGKSGTGKCVVNIKSSFGKIKLN